MEDDQNYITYPTYKKYLTLAKTINQIQIRQKRNIFQLLRSNKDDTAFMPAYGFTSGTFCMWQILNECKRLRKKERDVR